MSEREDQIRRLARVLAYRETGMVEFGNMKPLDNPKWERDAALYIDFILTGGQINE